ncbi:hypothetical protein OS493_004975 [Desmophyllum pertusum]|uniref:Uncharacterized protein n=1 Tax=Desmophyllum pertusum TaxID=174260 RepID=A0A9X0CT78_9CNID|nr:hypothetical protein OS493_004975 [Desmophyllum pertusum]
MSSGVVITQSGSVSAGVSNGSVSAGVSSGSVSAGASSGSVSAGVSNGSVSAGVSSGSVSAGASSGSVSAGVSSGSVSAGVSSGSVSAGASSGSVSAGASSGSVSAGASSGSVSAGVSSGAVSASAGSLSMSWPSIVTTAFGSMIATVSPSAHHSHALMSSHAHHGAPWWSSHNISESMERWLRFIRNNTDCKFREKFCPLKLQCIPDHEPCTIHLSHDKMRNLSSTAWCVNCSSNQYFCPLFMQCIDVNESCSYHNLYQWIKPGNSSNSSRVLSDIKCGFNETFSFKTMSCKKEDILQQREEQGHECGRDDEIFCPFSASCRNKSDCAPFHGRNYSSALKNDTFGWVHMCQIRNLVCPRVARTLFKCDRDRRRCNLTSSHCKKGEKPCEYDDRCIPVNTTCCPKGELFCNKSNHCIPKGKMCCPTGQERCKVTGACGVPVNCV